MIIIQESRLSRLLAKYNLSRILRFPCSLSNRSSEEKKRILFNQRNQMGCDGQYPIEK